MMCVDNPGNAFSSNVGLSCYILWDLLRTIITKGHGWVNKRYDYENANLRIHFGNGSGDAFVTLILSYNNSSDMTYMPLTLNHAVKLAQQLTSKLLHRAKHKDV